MRLISIKLRWMVVLVLAANVLLISQITTRDQHQLVESVVKQRPGLDRYKFPYQNLNGNFTKDGLPFSINPAIWNRTVLPRSSYIHDLSDSVLDKFVFASGASRGDFGSMLISVIGSIHKHYPTSKIIVYNMGIDHSTLEEIKTYCNVEVRSYDTTQYPPHTRNLFTYAFKALVINEVLRDHPGVFWLDSSGRMTSPDISQTLQDAKKTNGITLVRNTGHSNYAVTHPSMYKYLVTDQEMQKKVQQREANSMLIYRTEEIYENIYKPWLQCSLDPGCIAPHGAERSCRFGKSWWTDYGKCHRYDQAALNIILSNYFKYDHMMYKTTDEVCTIERGTFSMRIKPKICNTS